MRFRSRFLLALLLLSIAGCGRRVTPPPIPTSTPPPPPPPPARVLIVYERGSAQGGGLEESARALETLIAHFGERCRVIGASEYTSGPLGQYLAAFYLAGGAAAETRAQFVSDLSAYEGRLVWVGPGVEAIGRERLRQLGLEVAAGSGSAEAEAAWALSYRGQEHSQRVLVPAMRATAEAAVAVEARAGARRRPFLVGRGKLWYGAAGPMLRRDRFWSACIWAEALHGILGIRHGDERRMVAALRDVPVWVSERQVPQVIEPVLAAGVPVAVLVAARTGEVLLSDRPAAVRGLRRAEAMGATVALRADAGPEAREQLRSAWELGIHPVAWVGPQGRDNPFRLRVAEPDGSPPYVAGGLLPAPIPISDAGYIASDDIERLRMLRAVRDAVALVSFGLWAPPEPFLQFLATQRGLGWGTGDLRDLGVLVRDRGRTVVSGDVDPGLPSGARVRQTVLGPRWQVQAQQGESVPKRSVAVWEPVRPRPERPFLTGVTLDPWAYSDLGVSSETLAEALAERYSRNGVNTVFFYAYNVDEGAAYRTRYRGASVSDWGRQDLLGHLLEACRARNIRVVAWLYSGRDKGVWLKDPEWRERTAGGQEYNPLRLHATYFLCPRNPEVREWYAGLLRDLARRYPTLDGIELCEPLVNWWGDQACHCKACRQSFAAEHPGEQTGGSVWRQHRAEGLTEFLSECMKAIGEEGIDSYIMTISDAWSNGAILSPRRQAEESGFDLDALLDGPHPPDWVNYELIWQQWAAIYGDVIFNPDWAEETAQQLKRRTDGRARVVFHVELTDFGSQVMTPAKIAETIRRTSVARPDGVECYHSTAIDRKSAWSVLKRAYEALP